MKQNGLYWALFTPIIRKSVAKRFGKELAEQSIRHGKSEYKRLLRCADDLGPGNPMAMNAYFAYVFTAVWLGSWKQITPDEAAILLPWDTPEKAICGGALWIAKSYSEIGQDTLYFQKVDLIDNEDGWTPSDSAEASVNGLTGLYGIIFMVLRISA